MRIDANSGGKPLYFPNSYMTKAPTKGTAPSFDPSTAEAPMQFASNVLSRKGHYRHEGQISEYDQVRELYQRVLSTEERANLHSNTARLMVVGKVDNIVIKNYLIQLNAIAPLYAKGVWDKLPEARQATVDFTWDEIDEASKEAHLVGKNVSVPLLSLNLHQKLTSPLPPPTAQLLPVRHWRVLHGHAPRQARRRCGN